jgi:hypothetical protein
MLATGLHRALASKQLIFVCHSMGGINGRETSETASV